MWVWLDCSFSWINEFFYMRSGFGLKNSLLSFPFFSPEDLSYVDYYNYDSQNVSRAEFYCKLTDALSFDKEDEWKKWGEYLEAKLNRVALTGTWKLDALEQVAPITRVDGSRAADRGGSCRRGEEARTVPLQVCGFFLDQCFSSEYDHLVKTVKRKAGQFALEGAANNLADMAGGEAGRSGATIRERFLQKVLKICPSTF